MIQITAPHADRSDLEVARGHAQSPIQSMNLQIPLRRTTAGVALVSAHALRPAIEHQFVKIYYKFPFMTESI
jgi:hypothetical protein